MSNKHEKKKDNVTGFDYFYKDTHKIWTWEAKQLLRENPKINGNQL